MANKDDLKRKRRVDQRSALLALVVDKNSGKMGHCLSSQEMAELLDGKCTGEQRQLFLEHFSGCDICYREWLTLSQELERKKRVAPKPILMQRKVLAVSGSILAAAASVVFYLNLDQAPGPQQVLVPALPQLEMQASPETIQLPLRQKRMKSVAPAASIKKASPQLLEMKSESAEIPEERRAAVPMDRVEMASVDPAQQWFLQVEQKCEGDGNDVSWKELALQGGQLVQVAPSSVLQRVNLLVEKIVQGQEQSRMCSDIIRILQENTND